MNSAFDTLPTAALCLHLLIFSASCHKRCSDSVHCSWLSILNLEIPVLASTHQGRAVRFQSLCPIPAQCEHTHSSHLSMEPVQLLCPAQTQTLTQSPSAACHEFRFYRTVLGMSCNISCKRGEVLPTWDSVRVGFVHCVHPLCSFRLLSEQSHSSYSPSCLDDVPFTSLQLLLEELHVWQEHRALTLPQWVHVQGTTGTENPNA